MRTQANLEPPERTREYNNHHLDSTGWDEISPRDDDIIVNTVYKSGTVWTLQIANELVWQGRESERPKPLGTLSPWVDFRLTSKITFDHFNNVAHRRVFKSHLPLDGLRFFPQCKYLYVARGGLDVAMSWWNHYSSAKGLRDVVNNTPGRRGGRQGPELPEPQENLHAFFRDWISKGWFDGEEDGYPFWSFTHHAATWWKHRHLPNIMFLHYNDLKEDLPGMMRKIAAFLEIPILEDRWNETVRHCTFEYMKENANDLYWPGIEDLFQEGGRSLVHKGTNNRWKGVLTAEEVQQYRERMRAALPAECIQWLDRE